MGIYLSKINEHRCSLLYCRVWQCFGFAAPSISSSPPPLVILNELSLSGSKKYLFSVIGDMIFWIDRARLTGSVSYLLKIISICRMILSYWGPRLSRACVVRILKIYEFFRLKNGIENRLNYKWLIFSLDSCTSIIFSIFFYDKRIFLR